MLPLEFLPQYSQPPRNRWMGAFAGCCALFFALGHSYSKPPARPVVPPAAASETIPAGRAPQAGAPFDDREIIVYFEQEARKLLDAGKLAKLHFENVSCAATLPAPASTPVALTQVAASAEAATLIFGEFYREKKAKKLGFTTAAGGFLIAESGVCVTCKHVVSEKDGRGMVAMTRDGRVFAVREVLAADPVDDVAILQLELPAGEKVPALALAAAPAAAGAAIAIMSHPDERFYLLTTGTVARNTVWRNPSGDEHFMTVTADFAKGSSGCPVLNDCGAVVGLVNNTESIYYEDDGHKKQADLQMVVKNTTPAWVVRRMIR